MSPAVQVETVPLANRLKSAVERGDVVLPPLPELASRILDVLRDENAADPLRVGELIHNDPAMSASILRMANSAFFGGLQAVGDLSSAIARLGLRQVSSIVTAVAHKGHFTSANPERTKLLHVLWDQAVVCGLAARNLAAAAGADRAEAFLTGLLHDTGCLLVLKGVDELERRDPGMRATPPVVLELMDQLHTQLGHKVLVSWRIPEVVCRVALVHHDPMPADDWPVIRVQAADAIARKLGAHPEPDPELDLLSVPAIEKLNLGDLEVAALTVDVEDQLAQARSLF